MLLNKINGPDFVHTNEAHLKKKGAESCISLSTLVIH